MELNKRELYKKVKARHYRQCCKILQKVCFKMHEDLKKQDRKDSELYHAFLQTLEQEAKTEIKNKI